jgi:streptogramin lyase
VSLVAGDGTDSGKGRPGPADQASLGNNGHFAIAPDGDIFVINHENEVVYVHDGQMSLLYTGNGAAGESGFGGVAIGPDGDAYVTMGRYIRRIARDGTSTLVFDGATEGPGGSLGPISFDGAGNMYFYSNNTYRVLRRGAGGGLSEVAGTGKQGRIAQPPEGDGGPALASPLAVPTAMVVDGNGNLLIADTGTQSIRKVAPDGTITTIAGGGQSPLYLNGGVYAPDGTVATTLKLGGANGVAVDSSGRVYVADAADHIAFRFGSDGKIELIIADQLHVTEELGHPANETRGRNMENVLLDTSGNLLYTDSNRILTIEGAAKS